MVANTFVNNIPGWDEEEQFPIEDSVPHPLIASTSGVNPPSQEVEPMVEIEVSTTDDDNENIDTDDDAANNIQYEYNYEYTYNA